MTSPVLDLNQVRPTRAAGKAGEDAVISQLLIREWRVAAGKRDWTRFRAHWSILSGFATRAG